MIREIQAKTLLTAIRHPDAWFGVRYNMNIYRGCQHQCIYCDSRSECYQIEDFRDVLVKANALELLQQELRRKRIKGIVGTGSMSDPYTPAERDYDLSGRALELIARYGFGVHITTKSDLVLRDLARLQAVNAVGMGASVSFTLTTADDGLGRKLEPGAPLPSARLRTMRALAEGGIYTGVTLMPVLPFIEDNAENLIEIVERAREAGARYVIPGLGVTLRDRQRAYYYRELDRLFPGLSRRYRERYGDGYHCPVPGQAQLEMLVHERCARYGLLTKIGEIAAERVTRQLRLL